MIEHRFALLSIVTSAYSAISTELQKLNVHDTNKSVFKSNSQIARKKTHALFRIHS